MAAFLGPAGLRSALPADHTVTRQPIVGPDAIRFVPTPDGRVADNPAWLPDADLIVGAFGPPRGRAWESRLYTIRSEGTNFTPLPIPNDAECRNTAHAFPRILPDGRIGFIQRCYGSLTPGRRLPQQQNSLMAYDPRSGVTERLAPYWLMFNANNFDYSPDLQQGVIHDGVFLRGGLHWILPDRLERVSLPLGDVGYPRWSPDGRHIAARGRTTVSEPRASAPERPSTLFLITSDGKELRPLVERVKEATGVPAWSPDGSWLATRLTMEDGRDGIWLVEVATGALHPVLLDEDLGSANWSPDGRSLVVAVGTYSGDKSKPVNHRLGLYFIDLPDLDQLVTPARA